MANDTQKYRGTLKYENLEGGAWIFHAEDGRHYMLEDLDESFRENGVSLEIEGFIAPSFSFVMAGPTIKVTAVHKI